jgi:hypothetical protein
MRPLSRVVRYKIKRSKTATCRYAETSLEIEGNQDVINFLKQHFFKKAVFIKFGSEKYEINTFLNNSIFEILVPYEFDLHSTVIEYLAHYVIEIAVGADRNLPCADAASSNLVDLLRKIAARDVTVLINGPTGTWKRSCISINPMSFQAGQRDHLLP